MNGLAGRPTLNWVVGTKLGTAVSTRNDAGAVTFYSARPRTGRNRNENSTDTDIPPVMVEQ